MHIGWVIFCTKNYRSEHELYHVLAAELKVRKTGLKTGLKTEKARR